MKQRGRSFVGAAILLCAIASIGFANAAQPKEARITQIIKDVQILPGQATPRLAAVSDAVPEGTVVRTGVDSRSELTFTDQSIVRLGANSSFSFKRARHLEIENGVALLQVPKKARGMTIRRNEVAAVVTGTTVVFEYHEPIFKFLVLQGVGRLYRPGHLGDSVLVQAGQMVFGKSGEALSDPVSFDVERFVKTSRLITQFPALRTESLMAKESEKQRYGKAKKTLIETNLVIFGEGTAVTLTQVANGQNAEAASTSEAAPPPISAINGIGLTPRIDRALANPR